MGRGTRAAGLVALLGLALACARGVRPDAPGPRRPEQPSHVREAQAAVRGGPHPAAPTGEVAELIHGVQVKDPCRWVEDFDAPSVQSWLRAEDRRTRAYLEHVEGVTDLWQRMAQLWPSGLAAEPARDRPERSPVFVKTPRGITRRWKDEERLLVASDTLPDSARFGALFPSPDGAYLAYEVVSHGRDRRALRVVEARTGASQDLDEVPELEDSTPVWRSSPRGFFYAASPRGVSEDTRSAYRATRFHRLGTPVVADTEVVPATHDPLSNTAIGPRALLPDGRHLLVVEASTFEERRYALVDVVHRPPTVSPLSVPGATLQFAALAGPSILAGVARVDGSTAFVKWSPPYAAPNVVVDAPPEEPITHMDVYGTRAVLERSLGPRVRFDLYDGQTVVPVLQQRSGEFVRPLAVDDHDATFAREGLVRPPERVKVDLATGAQTIVAGATAPLDPSRFRVDAFELRSADGTPIAVTTVRPSDGPITTETRLWVEGYGGFSWGRPRYYYPGIVTWVERGGVYAYVHLRGGSEYGPRFAAASRRAARPRVYEDFAQAIRALHARGVSSPEYTAIHGHSNGGLLVAAVAILHPELVRFVYDEAGLADMVRYPRWGRAGMPEYGDPEDAHEFQSLYSTSPYHNVREGVQYPTFFLTISTGDERVSPIHGAKLAAALLRASPRADVFLKVYWDAGHLGDVASMANDPNRSYAEAMAMAMALPANR